MNGWARLEDEAGRVFSVEVDATLEAGASATEVDAARESATPLLGLPWELLHDGGRLLFQGAKPTPVRRRLPSMRVLDVPVVATPIRILLVTARPEDEACGYIDHRASALPLVEATEALGGLVHIHVLAPPTLSALRDELDRARRDLEPYHVVHFDGHGVYDPLAAGARVGDAMLEGQRTLKDDTFRGRIFGAGELRLEDWFVPVLFQEKDDPQLFRTTPSRQTREDLQTALDARRGALPKEPETGFIGRSRDLLALQRLLRQDGKARYAVVRGQGGEGKTALAAEFARWMVRSHQIRRPPFVSVETHSNVAADLDPIDR